MNRKCILLGIMVLLVTVQVFGQSTTAPSVDQEIASLKAEIATLRAELAALNASIDALRAAINDLRTTVKPTSQPARNLFVATTQPQTPTYQPSGMAPQVQPTPKTATNEEETVYVTRTGAKYHRAGCRYLRQSSIPMKLKEAKARYTPCSVCNPPE